MATDWQTFPLEFKGGLVSNLSPLQQGTNAVGSATVLQNFEPSLSGGYAKVKGFQKFNNSLIPIKAADGSTVGSPSEDQKKIQCIALVKDNYTAVVVRNGSYYVVTSGSLTQGHSATTAHWNGNSGTTTRTGITGGTKVRFANYNFGNGEKTIFVDGVNAPAFYSGGSAATSVSFANASDAQYVPIVGSQFVTVFKNHIVTGKNVLPNGASSVFFGAANTDNSFSTNALQINVKDTITGLIVFRESLIIFTKNTIQRVTGSSTDASNADVFKLSPITEDIGCIREDTIQEVGGDVLFFAPDGIRSLAATEKIGDFGLEVASKPIKKNVDTLSGTSYDSITIREKGQYRIFAYNQDFNIRDSEGLIATKFVDQGGTGLNWSTIKGFKSHVSDSRYYGQAGALAEMILFGNDDGYIYQSEITNALDTVAIKAIYESPFMPINDPTLRKTFYKLGLYLDPNGAITAQVSLKYDQNDVNVIQPDPIDVTTTGTGISFYNNSESTYDSDSYSSDFNKLYNNNVVGSGKTVAIRIEEESTNPTFRLDTAVLEYSVETRQ
jgi:hypothetical protein